MFAASTSGTTDYWAGEESRSRYAEEIALPIDEIVPYEARAAVPISVEAAKSLLLKIRYHDPDHPDEGRDAGARQMGYLMADDVGFDIRRLFGDAGYELYRDYADCLLFDPDCDDEGEPESACRQRFTDFDRPRKATDQLLIDGHEPTRACEQVCRADQTFAVVMVCQWGRLVPRSIDF